MLGLEHSISIFHFFQHEILPFSPRQRYNLSASPSLYFRPWRTYCNVSAPLSVLYHIRLAAHPQVLCGSNSLPVYRPLTCYLFLSSEGLQNHSLLGPTVKHNLSVSGSFLLFNSSSVQFSKPIKSILHKPPIYLSESCYLLQNQRGIATKYYLLNIVFLPLC